MMEQRHVLIIEDDEELAEMYMKALMLRGYAVSHAPDARSAFSLLEGTSPDLAIVDYTLDGMSGAEFIREVKRKGHPIKTILINLGDGTYRYAQEAGADSWMDKMSGLRVLLGLVYRLINADTPGSDSSV